MTSITSSFPVPIGWIPPCLTSPRRFHREPPRSNSGSVCRNGHSDAPKWNDSNASGDRVRTHAVTGHLKTFHRFPLALRVDAGVPAAAPDGEIEDGSRRCRDDGGTPRPGHGVTVDYV